MTTLFWILYCLWVLYIPGIVWVVCECLRDGDSVWSSFCHGAMWGPLWIFSVLDTFEHNA